MFHRSRAERRYAGWLPWIVRNLPDLVVRSAGAKPRAVMIARGDLAAEIGPIEVARAQEEILRLGGAAHVPTVWATQVLDRGIRKGAVSRGEVTDAATAARADGVLLNEGRNLLRGVRPCGNPPRPRMVRLRAAACAGQQSEPARTNYSIDQTLATDTVRPEIEIELVEVPPRE